MPTLCPYEQANSFRDNTIHGNDCDFEPEGAIYLGRVDYNLQAIDRAAHKQVWNVTVGEFISPDSRQVGTSGASVLIPVEQYYPSFITTFLSLGDEYRR